MVIQKRHTDRHDGIICRILTQDVCVRFTDTETGQQQLEVLYGSCDHLMRDQRTLLADAEGVFWCGSIHTYPMQEPLYIMAATHCNIQLIQNG